MVVKKIRMDASQARQEIESVNQAVSRYLKLVQKANAQQKKLTAANISANKHLANWNKTLKKAGGHLNSNSRSAGIFARSLTRLRDIIFTFAGYGGIFLIVNELRQSIGAAKEYTKAISEIRTISTQNAMSTEQWMTSVIGLSNAFGFGTLEVAEAAYQSLSNQVTEAGNTFAFLQTQVGLALATVTSLDGTVNATTAVLNAYNLNASQASMVSGVLFKTVEEGRVRLDDLGQTIGRVAILSSQLGVSFVEQQAAMTQLTKLGVRSEEAMTLLRNVELKLLKPTERLKELFTEWGVSSGQTAVQTFGLAGVIGKLGKEAESSGDKAAQMADIMKQLRSIVGVTGLEMRPLTEEIAKFGNAAEDSIEAIIERTSELDTRANKHIQQFKNAFVQGFGRPALKMLVDFGDYMGGTGVATLRFLRIAERTILVGGAMVLTFGSLSAATRTYTAVLTVFKVALYATEAAERAAAISAIRLSVALGAITLVVGAAVWVWHKLANKTRELKSRTQELNLELQQSFSTQAIIAMQRFSAEVDTITQRQLAATDAIRKKNLQMIASVRAANTLALADTAKMLEAIELKLTDSFKNGVAGAKDSLEELVNTLKEVQETIKDAEKKGQKNKLTLKVDQAILDVDKLGGSDQAAALNKLLLRIESLGQKALTIDLDQDTAAQLFKQADRVIEKLREVRTNLTADVLPESLFETDPSIPRPLQRAEAKARERRQDQLDAANTEAVQEATLKFEQDRIKFLEKRNALNDIFIDKMKKVETIEKERVALQQKRLALLQGIIKDLDNADASDPDGFAAKKGQFASASQGVLSPEARFNILRELNSKESSMRKQLDQEEYQRKLDNAKKLQLQALEARDKLIRSQNEAEKKAFGAVTAGIADPLITERIASELAGLQGKREAVEKKLRIHKGDFDSGGPTHDKIGNILEAKRAKLLLQENKLKNIVANVIKFAESPGEGAERIENIEHLVKLLSASTTFNNIVKNFEDAIMEIDATTTALEKMEKKATSARQIINNLGTGPQDTTVDVEQNISFNFGDVRGGASDTETAKTIIYTVKQAIRSGELKI